jgi:hypothetical protein
MPRTCVTCAHPKRAEIDKKLALGLAAKRHIAAEYEIAERSLHRHENECLDPSLVEAAKKLAAAESGSLVARVTKMVDRLEKVASQCEDYGTAEALLKVARELRPYHELFGRANGQLASDRINAMFIQWGVSGEEEVKQRLELTRRGSESSPEEWLEDALAMLDFSLAQIPHKSQYAVDRVKAAARKVGMLEPHTNGHGGSNGSRQA